LHDVWYCTSALSIAWRRRLGAVLRPIGPSVIGRQSAVLFAVLLPITR
jgi:hypothetical protein